MCIRDSVWIKIHSENVPGDIHALSRASRSCGLKFSEEVALVQACLLYTSSARPELDIPAQGYFEHAGNVARFWKNELSSIVDVYKRQVF